MEGEIGVTSAVCLVDKTLAEALLGGGICKGSSEEKSGGHLMLLPRRICGWRGRGQRRGRGAEDLRI